MARGDLGTSKAQEKDGCIARMLLDVIDQLEQAALRPVEIFENDDQRTGSSELLEETAHRPVNLFGRSAPLVGSQDLRKSARYEPATFGIAKKPLNLGMHRVIIVIGFDAGRLLNHLLDGPERDPFSIRQTAARKHPRAAFDAACELPRDPRLADSGIAQEHEEPALSGTNGIL